MLLHRGINVGRNLIGVDESLVESGRFAVAQDRGCDLERAGVGRGPRRNVPHLVDPSLRHPILHRSALTPRAFGDPGPLPRDGWSRRNVAEVMLDFFPRRLDVDVAGDDEDGVRRTIVGLEPSLHVFELRGVQVLHRADDGPGVGVVRWIESGGEKVPHLAVRLILVLPLLVLHHAALLVELGLGDGAHQVTHTVRFEPELEVQSRGRNVDEVVGAVLVGRPVEIGGSGPLQRGLKFLVVVLAAVEHQMLEEMRETGVTRLLILGAHVIPDVHRDDRGLMVFVHDHRQTVGQDEPLVRNVGCGLGGGLNGPDQSAQRREEAGETMNHVYPHESDVGTWLAWFTPSQYRPRSWSVAWKSPKRTGFWTQLLAPK